MRVVVCGSRSWAAWPPAKDKAWKPSNHEYWQMTGLTAILTGLVDRSIINGETLKVIHGGCPSGADAIAAKWCDTNDIESQVFPADWNTHGKAAGFIRNEQMIVEGQPIVVVAAWDGQSKGTKHTIDLAAKHNIPVIRLG